MTGNTVTEKKTIRVLNPGFVNFRVGDMLIVLEEVHGGVIVVIPMGTLGMLVGKSRILEREKRSDSTVELLRLVFKNTTELICHPQMEADLRDTEMVRVSAIDSSFIELEPIA